MTVAFPSLGFKQLLFLLIRQALFRRCIVPLFFLAPFVACTPIGERRFSLWSHVVEIGKEFLTKLIIEFRTNLFIAGRKSQ